MAVSVKTCTCIVWVWAESGSSRRLHLNFVLMINVCPIPVSVLLRPRSCVAVYCIILPLYKWFCDSVNDQQVSRFVYPIVRDYSCC